MITFVTRLLMWVKHGTATNIKDVTQGSLQDQHLLYCTMKLVIRLGQEIAMLLKQRLRITHLRCTGPPASEM